MRGFVVSLALLTAVSYPLTAHATTCPCDVLTIQQVGAPANVYTFTVPVSSTPAFPADTDKVSFFDLNNITVTGPLGYSSTNDTVYFYPTTPTYTSINNTGSFFGGLWDPNLINRQAQPGSSPRMDSLLPMPPFFSGSVMSPTFKTPALTSNGPLVNYWGDGTYNFSVTAASSSPTPEPSSLVLLGTGTLGLVSAWRRRRLA